MAVQTPECVTGRANRICALSAQIDAAASGPMRGSVSGRPATFSTIQDDDQDNRRSQSDDRSQRTSMQLLITTAPVIVVFVMLLVVERRSARKLSRRRMSTGRPSIELSSRRLPPQLLTPGRSLRLA
jgi:flagellar biosynthesis/type III secretory pathway M-ring protein FliF/YscJ